MVLWMRWRRGGYGKERDSHNWLGIPEKRVRKGYPLVAPMSTEYSKLRKWLRSAWKNYGWAGTSFPEIEVLVFS